MESRNIGRVGGVFRNGDGSEKLIEGMESLANRELVGVSAGADSGIDSMALESVSLKSIGAPDSVSGEQ